MRPRPCTHCKALFTPQRMGQHVCSPICAVRAVRAKKVEERAQIKMRKEAIKTLPVLKREAQVAFNAFIRERDRQAGHACISSNKPLDWSGNATDCGHFRSVGSAPHLRFHEDNAHAQSKHDNQFLSGNAIAYRAGLIARIGLERVEALESDNTSRHYTADDLREIRKTYVAKLRALKSVTAGSR